MEKKTMIITEYLPYRFTDLEIEQQSQEMKANNANLSPSIRMDALQRIEVIQLVLEMYMFAVNAGHDVTNMSVETAIYVTTGKKFENHGHTGVVRAYHSVDGAVGKAVDVTVDATRTGMNWLGRKLQQWSDKK